MEDNLMSADPISYTTNGSRVDQGARSERFLAPNDTHSTASCGAPDHILMNTQNKNPQHFLESEQFHYR